MRNRAAEAKANGGLRPAALRRGRAKLNGADLEEQAREAGLIDDDGSVARIYPPRLGLCLLLPHRQVFGSVEWIDRDLHKIEMRIAALPVQERADRLFARLAGDPGLLLSLDAGGGAILAPLHRPALRHRPSPGGAGGDEAHLQASVPFPRGEGGDLMQERLGILPFRGLL